VCICAVQDVLVINRTNDTLQNVCLELATLGDLKLCERPQNYTVGPKGKRWIKANIKVSSTETGVIFGNLVYDVAGSSASDKNCVVLNDIHVDIMDYITPATTSEVLYRIMWAEFEWENKVAINSSIRYVSRERESVCVCMCVCVATFTSTTNHCSLMLTLFVLVYCCDVKRFARVP
jgi:coatomer subunit beta